MAQDRCSFTVFFEDPFWIGLVERQGKEGYQAARVVFGGEPRDGEIYAWLLARWGTLRFSPFLPENAPKTPKMNPKRARREARKCLSGAPGSTKAREAIKRGREESKTAQGQSCQALQRKTETEKFRLRQEKKRQKHKGH